MDTDAWGKAGDSLWGSAWEAFVGATADIVFLKDKNLVYVSASQAFADMVGCDSPRDLVGKSDFDIFADQELARRYTQDDRQLMESGQAREAYIEPIPAHNGAPRYASTQKSLLRNAQGEIVGLLGISRDVTAEYAAKRAYEGEMKLLSQGAADILAVALVDVTLWQLLYLRCQREDDPLIRGEGSVGELWQVLSRAPEAARFYGKLDQQTIWELFSSGRQTLSKEYRRLISGDQFCWVRDELRLIIEPVSGHLELVLTVRDIEERRREQAALRRAAERDAMTGLYHNRAVMKECRRYLTQEGSAGRHALFIIDLDNFKAINDTFGHKMGDEVILSTANALRQVFRGSDTLGRIGGDEFLVLMKNVEKEDNVRLKGQYLVESLQYACRQDDQVVELSGSVGIAIYQGDGQSLDSLYALADAALYRAKDRGKNLYLIAGEEEEVRPWGEEFPLSQHSCAVRLQMLLENMDGCVLVCQVEEEITFIYASPNSAQRMGWDPTWRSLEMDDTFAPILPQDQEALRQAIFRAAREETGLDVTFRILSPEGACRWWRMRGNRLPDQEAQELILVVTDVTNMIETEEALRFAQLRYRTAVEQSDVMLWEVDLRQKTLCYAGDMAQRLGLAGKVFHGLPDGFLAAGVLRPQSEGEFRRAIQNLFAGNDREEYTMAAVDPQGRSLTLKGHFRLLRDESGTPYCAVGIMRPIL